jgi:hypothetical protein
MKVINKLECLSLTGLVQERAKPTRANHFSNSPLFGWARAPDLDHKHQTMLKRRHDTQHNDIHNNDTHHKELLCDTQPK